MKVWIDESAIWIEDGPEPDPDLPEREGIIVARLHALTWAIARISETTKMLLALENDRSAAAELEAAQAIDNIRRGMH